MGSRRWFMGAVSASLVAGCGRRCGSSIVEDPPPLEVELDPSWETWSLPIGDGVLVFSNNRMLTVEYETGSVEALAAAWIEAITRAGWTRAIDTSSEEVISVSFVREGETLALGVFPGLFGITVTLTTFPTP